MAACYSQALERRLAHEENVFAIGKLHVMRFATAEFERLVKGGQLPQNLPVDLERTILSRD